MVASCVGGLDVVCLSVYLDLVSFLWDMYRITREGLYNYKVSSMYIPSQVDAEGAWTVDSGQWILHGHIARNAAGESWIVFSY